MKSVFVLGARVYKWYISPIMVSVLGGSCRYQPTCSEYTAQAFEKYGIIRGGYLALKRIASCHPWGKFGFDPIS